MLRFLIAGIPGTSRSPPVGVGASAGAAAEGDAVEARVVGCVEGVDVRVRPRARTIVDLGDVADVVHGIIPGERRGAGDGNGLREVALSPVDHVVGRSGRARTERPELRS